MRKKSLLAVAVSAAALGGLSAAPAFAGEVKGPPGTRPIPGGSQNFTGAPAHSNSICSFSGLNDFDPLEGATTFHAQSYGIDVSGKGDPANPHVFNPGDICQGGSNPQNPPSP
jgi:opacity protein-like surface antigen